MPAKWRVAESLQTLLAMLNDAFPRRSKASDGSIGDAAHASRSSDHNPHVKLKGQGIVTARDFTHDPQTGIDCNWLAATLEKSRDSRIKYFIWNRRIMSGEGGPSPWQWRPYSGVNAHTKHLHVSVKADPKLFDSTKPWKLEFPKPVKSDVARVTEPDPEPQPVQPPAVVPTVPAPVPVIEVEAVSAAPAEAKPKEEEGTLTKIGNKANAAYTAFGTMIAGVIAWMTSTPLNLAISIVVAVAACGAIYMIINAIRTEMKERREDRAKLLESEKQMAREKQAHEVLLFTMKSAADPDMSAVKVVQPPPSTELPNSDAPAEATT